MAARKISLDLDYYQVKGYNTIAITKNGEVFDLVKRKTLIPYPDGDGYPCVNIPGSGTRKVHRLVIETFLPKPDPHGRYITNHIDGDKTNPKLENLEWVTYSGNINHAYQTGLRSDNKRLEVMDLRSGEIKQFHSLQETARFFKRNGEVVFRYLKSQRTAPFMSYFSIRHVDEEWPALTVEHVGTHQNGQAREIIAVPEDTSKSSMIFSGLGAAAKIFECSAAAICKNIKQPVNKLFRGHKFYYLAGYDKDVSNFLDCREAEKAKPIAPTRTPQRVKVVDRNTGQTVMYNSLQEFCDTIGVAKDGVQKQIWKTHGTWKNYVIEYIR